MAPVTEIALLPVKSGCQFDNPATDDGALFQESLNTILEQDGAQRVYWGREKENPTNLHLLVDWDSIDSHKNFMKSTPYGPFSKTLGTLLDGAPMLFHSSLTPHPPAPAVSDTNAPVTDIMVSYFSNDISDSDKKAFWDALESVKDHTTSADGFKGLAGGWVVEDVPNSKFSDKEKFTCYVSFIGWESAEAHKKYNESSEFKEKISPVFSDKGVKHRQVYLVSFTEIQGGVQSGLGADERGEIGGGAADAQEEVLNPQGGQESAPKTRSDGTTTKNDSAATNAQHSERQGRGPASQGLSRPA